MLVEYQEKYQRNWDDFVINHSINGTFFQTRRFLNYHPVDKFEDNSILFTKGNNIIAVIPANVVKSDKQKHLISHMGSSYGGIVLGKQFNKIADVEMIFRELDEYLSAQQFTYALFRQTSEIYEISNSKILEYFFFYFGYNINYEMGYYGNLDHYSDDLSINFNASRRRGLKNSQKNNLLFRELTTREDISEFYNVLQNNMKKFHTTPGHSLEELFNLKNKILKDDLKFYGVYYGHIMIAGSMVFCIERRVFLTHYLATRQESLSIHPSEFLYKELIEIARKENFAKIAFGNCTFDLGKTLHKSLAQYKEGFGTEIYINRFFSKKYTL